MSRTCATRIACGISFRGRIIFSISPARRAISIRCAIPCPIWRSTATRSSRSSKRAAPAIRDIKIVFASTRQIYGRPERLPVPETHPLNPVDVNGINKMAGEKYHLLYNDVHGVSATALRLTNTIGPRMRIKDARQTFVGVWIRQLLEGKPIEVWGGQQLRDFTDVDDAVDAFLLAAADPKTNGAGLQPRRQRSDRPGRASPSCSSR